MRVGIIRCEERSNECAGYKCLPAMQNRTGQFKGYDAIELVGFETCGGCGRNKADKISWVLRCPYLWSIYRRSPDLHFDRTQSP